MHLLLALDAVVKREIPSPRRKSNPRTPIFQPIQTVALSLLCAMSLVQLLFVDNLLNAFLVLQLQFQWPRRLLVWRSVSYSTFAEFSCV